MEFYPTLLTLHIISAGIWLSNLISSQILKKFIIKNKQKPGEKKFIILSATISNAIGMTGAIGILITGIIMTAMNPGYGFFQMSANHWLTAKQIVMVIILVIIFAFLIPRAKKVNAELNKDLEGPEPISAEGYQNIMKMGKLGMTVGMLVVLNFLLAITHRFFF